MAATYFTVQVLNMHLQPICKCGSTAAGLACCMFPLGDMLPLGMPLALQMTVGVALVSSILESLQLGIDDNFTVGIGSLLTAILIASLG